MNHKSKNESGFSYIEMSVVVIIIGILCAIMLAGFKPAEKEISLRNSAYQVAGDIRKAQNMAMATVEQNGNDPFGYGVHFVSLSDSYFIFADMDDDKKYTGADIPIDPNPINLSDGIEISSASPASPLDIVFTSPDPTTFINTSDAIGVFSTVRLRIKDGNPFDFWDVTIETSGNIKVQ